MHWNREDVATPVKPLTVKTQTTDGTTIGPDGFRDLTLHARLNSCTSVLPLHRVADSTSEPESSSNCSTSPLCAFNTSNARSIAPASLASTAQEILNGRLNTAVPSDPPLL